MPRRGVHRLGRLQISSCFPLGLFRAWSNIDIDNECIVYPAPKGQLPLPQQGGASHHEHQGTEDGHDDFAGLRRYRHGDSSRRLDWKTYAREKGLHSKEFQGFGGKQIVLTWQQLEHLNHTEDILSQLCQWVLQAAKNQDQYALEIPGRNIELNSGESHKLDCLEALARFGMKNT